LSRIFADSLAFHKLRSPSHLEAAQITLGGVVRPAVNPAARLLLRRAAYLSSMNISMGASWQHPCCQESHNPHPPHSALLEILVNPVSLTQASAGFGVGMALRPAE